MKITSSKKHNREIEIVVVMEDTQEVNSSVNIEDRPNLPIDKRYSEFQLDWYEDLISSVESAITSSGFNIIDQYQSSDSYSYYIEFEAFTREGKSLGDFTIKFRISDHDEPSKKKLRNRGSNDESAQERIQKASSRFTIFRVIKIGELTPSGMVQTANIVKEACNHLLDGDVDYLDKLGR